MDSQYCRHIATKKAEVARQSPLWHCAINDIEKKLARSVNSNDFCINFFYIIFKLLANV